MVQDRPSERPQARQPEVPAGEWLYKLHGEILGPVPAPEIIERMHSGEVDESTEICLGEGEWKTIQAVTDFHPFLYQAKARIRAQRARAEAEQAARRRRLRNMIKVALGAVTLVVLSFLASYFLIVSRPWRSGGTLRAWAGKHMPLLSVASATLDRNTAEMAEDDGINIDQILIDDSPALVAIKSRTGSKRRKRPAKKKTTAKTSARATDKPKSDDKPKIASLTPLTNDEIIDIVYSRSSMARLKICIRREIRRKTELPAVIQIEFTISNDGQAGKVRMDNIKLDGSALHKCFSKKISNLRFRSFSGQVRNVTIPFTIPKPK